MANETKITLIGNLTADTSGVARGLEHALSELDTGRE